jgi:polysaccharide pyruvyl transferase WcaK-like protein
MPDPDAFPPGVAITTPFPAPNVSHPDAERAADTILPDDAPNAAFGLIAAARDPAPGFPVPLDSIADAAGILLCPDSLYRTISEALPGRIVVPICASATLTAGQIGAVVVHKPSIHRLDFGLLAEIVARFAPTYADAIHVLYRRDGATDPLPPEMALHLGFVEHHLRHVPMPAPGELRRRRALVVSAHGAGNVGDDAVSLAAAEIARAVGFESVDLSGPGCTPQQLDAADLVVVGGGGLLYDIQYLGATDAENVGNYTAPLLRARLLGKPSVGLGLGTQGIATPIGRRVFGHALRTADLLTVRDKGDLEELDGCAGFRGARLTADLAFALRAFERPGRPLPALMLEGDFPDAGRPLALVALPSTISQAFGDGLDGLAAYGVALVRELLATHEVVLAQHSTDDAELGAILSKATGVRAQALERIGVRATLALYRAASLVVSGRYHGIVFAALGESSNVVAVGGEPTKIGRLIRYDLPSLRHARVDPFDLPRTAPGDVVARAIKPAAAEVDRLEARALENIGLLNVALRARGTAHASSA